MPNPNAVVGLPTRIERESFELEGRRYQLAPETARLRPILEGAVRQRTPVYLEIDPATSNVTRLLLPHVSPVRAVHPEPDGLAVELELSHAIHHLRRTAPDFEAFERQLRAVIGRGDVVIITVDDAHNIIDVRGLRPGPDGPLPPFPPFPPFPKPKWPWPFDWIRHWLSRFWRWPWWPWWWFRFGCMSPARAQQIFDAMAATSCAPLTVPPPCIPFMYPDDGCWGRAHEMCRLMMQNFNVTPRKVWIRSSPWPARLHVDTKNNPFCFVEWGWHVAPTICVRRWWWWFLWPREMVIDPSIFTTPVTKAQWKAIQNEPNATLTDTDWTMFHLNLNWVDAGFTNSDAVLNTYRMQLQIRSAGPAGPPPYANCP